MSKRIGLVAVLLVASIAGVPAQQSKLPADDLAPNFKAPPQPAWQRRLY